MGDPPEQQADEAGAGGLGSAADEGEADGAVEPTRGAVSWRGSACVCHAGMAAEM